jgi:hypothetical protein
MLAGIFCGNDVAQFDAKLEDRLVSNFGVRTAAVVLTFV